MERLQISIELMTESDNPARFKLMHEIYVEESSVMAPPTYWFVFI